LIAGHGFAVLLLHHERRSGGFCEAVGGPRESEPSERNRAQEEQSDADRRIPAVHPERGVWLERPVVPALAHRSELASEEAETGSGVIILSPCRAGAGPGGDDPGRA
jgi:hypothetical protein